MIQYPSGAQYPNDSLSVSQPQAENNPTAVDKRRA